MNTSRDPAPRGSSRNPSVGAVILSAGISRRMGAFKPLLHLEGKTVLEHAVTLFPSAGIATHNVVVVAGHRADDVCPLADRLGVHCVVNRRYREGMFASIQTGLRHLAPTAKDLFVLPVDQPLIRIATLTALMAARMLRPGSYWHPVFRGIEGHPPLLGPEVVRDALRRPVAGTLRDVLARHRPDAVPIRVADEGTVLDMDTPEAFRKGQLRLRRLDEPSEEEALALLQEVLPVDPAVRDTGRQLAGVSLAVGRALGAAGVTLDPGRIHSIGILSALLCQEAGAASASLRQVEALGFRATANALRQMAVCDEMGTSPLDETQVVFLARWMIHHGGQSKRTPCRRKAPGPDAAAERILQCTEQIAGPSIRTKLQETVRKIKGADDFLDATR